MPWCVKTMPSGQCQLKRAPAPLLIAAKLFWFILKFLRSPVPGMEKIFSHKWIILLWYQVWYLSTTLALSHLLIHPETPQICRWSSLRIKLHNILQCKQPHCLVLNNRISAIFVASSLTRRSSNCEESIGWCDWAAHARGQIWLSRGLWNWTVIGRTVTGRKWIH